MATAIRLAQIIIETNATYLRGRWTNFDIHTSEEYNINICVK